MNQTDDDATVNDGDQVKETHAGRSWRWPCSDEPATVLDAWGEHLQPTLSTLRALGVEAPFLEAAASDSFTWSADIADAQGASELATSLRETAAQFGGRRVKSEWIAKLDATQGGFSRVAAALGRSFTTCPFSGAVVSTNHCLPVMPDGGVEAFLFYPFQSTELFFVIVAGFSGSKSLIFIPSSNIVLRLHSGDFFWTQPAVIVSHLCHAYSGNEESIASYLREPTEVAIISGTISNIGHFFWNEVSGLISYDQAGLIGHIGYRISGRFSFIDPFVFIRPKSDCVNVSFDSSDGLLKYALQQRLFCVRPTHSYFSAETSQVIIEACRKNASRSERDAIERAKSKPFILWVALRAHNKVWLNQAEGIVRAAERVINQFGEVALFVDGLGDCAGYLDELKSMLPNEATVFSGLNIIVYDTVNWASNIDGYLATIGSGLTFVTWLAGKPGVAQSERHHLPQMAFWGDVRQDAPIPLHPLMEEIDDIGEGIHQPGMYCNYMIKVEVIARLMDQLIFDNWPQKAETSTELAEH